METYIYHHADADGAAAAALVSRVLSSAKLIPVRTASELTNRLKWRGNSIILDLGSVSVETVKKLEGTGFVVVIDHHAGERLPCVHINPRLDGKPAYPPSLVCWWMYGGPQWVAMLGVIGDWFTEQVPEFVNSCRKLYPALIKSGDQESIYFNDVAGKWARALDAVQMVYGPAGSAEAVKRLLGPMNKFFTGKVKSGFEIVEREVSRVVADGFAVEGQLAYTVFESKYVIKSAVVQRLKSRTKKTFMAAQLVGDKYNFSLRGGKNLNEVVVKALQGLEGSGGGHPTAAGGWVAKKDFAKFKENLKSLL